MKKNVILTIQGKQYYHDLDPEVIELVTEGTLEKTEAGWTISYEESALTGLEGVTTTFQVEPDKLTLERKGALQSRMVFQLGVLHESLYQMEAGALMIGVCATKIAYKIDGDGGTLDLTYGIDIEQSVGGVVEYHLDIRPNP